ncbi:MAG: hypothetical protein ABIS03_14580 [Gemmatimonadaceae bacterium]
MVDITVGEKEVAFVPHGWSRVWTVDARVVVPLRAIRTVSKARPGIGRGWFKGWRLPGTHIPGVIVAGSYYRNGEWTFWDVRGIGETAIEVELSGVHFTRLIVDVGDPASEVSRLLAALPT